MEQISSKNTGRSSGGATSKSTAPQSSWNEAELFDGFERASSSNAPSQRPAVEDVEPVLPGQAIRRWCPSEVDLTWKLSGL